MIISFIILVLFLHLIFDFCLQTSDMAINKAVSFSWLTRHCAIYSLWGFVVSCILGLHISLILIVMSYLFVTHIFIDFVTSKINRKLSNLKDKHLFFAMIGFDQLLHYITIFWFFDKFFLIS